MTSPVQDDVEEQMRQRRLREEARREKQRQGSSAENKMDVDNEYTELTGDNSRIIDLQKAISERKQKMDRLEAKIKELQKEYNDEMTECKKEEDELNQLQDVSTDVTIREAGGNENRSNQTENQTHQIMNDEEVARYLAMQFEREEQEQDAYLNERTVIEPGIGIRNQRSNLESATISTSNPTPVSLLNQENSANRGISFQFSSSTVPGGGTTSFSSFRQTGFPLDNFDSFLGNDMLLTSEDGFQPSPSGFGFPFAMPPRDDPFSSMRIFPRISFPGRMFGGALMDENMDYETLMRLFPPAPTRAQAADIERLPVDTFRVKSKENDDENNGFNTKNTNESKEEEQKKDDEFHRCCICLESFKDGDEIRRLPCLHIFHTAEIDEWLTRNHLCPICRTPIEQNEPQQRP